MELSAVAVTLALALSAGADGPAPPVQAPTPVEVAGTALPLAKALDPFAPALDPEATEGQVVLKAGDGQILPILRDEASRALFLDERLRERPLKIAGRKFPGLPYLQVITFRAEHEGQFRIPEYWCEVCSIGVRAPQICPCCQGPMELRFKPEGR